MALDPQELELQLVESLPVDNGIEHGFLKMQSVVFFCSCCWLWIFGGGCGCFQDRIFHWVVVTHTFNFSTSEEEAVKSL